MNPSNNTSRAAPKNYVPRGFPEVPNDWQSAECVLPSFDQRLNLYSILYSKKNSPIRNVLFITHGAGEHSGRYQHFPHYLQTGVDAIVAWDHRGHGRSEGTQGHVDHFDDYARDAEKVIRTHVEKFSKEGHQPQFHFLGHSMGGLVAFRTVTLAKDLPLKSVSLSAPSFRLKVVVPPIKKMLGIGLARIWGEVQMTSVVDAKTLSHDPAVAQAYEEDLLVHDKVTPKFFVEFSRTMAESLENPPEFGFPVLFLVPGADAVIDSDATREVFKRLQMKNDEMKEIREYPDFFHEAFNEKEKEKPFGDLLEWLKQRSV